MRKFKYIALLIISIMLLNPIVANASSRIAIDTNRVKEGIVRISYEGLSKKTKVMVEKGSTVYYYDLKNEEDFFPLQFGDGNYTVSVLENVSGTKYKLLTKKSFKADIVMTDVPYGNLVAWQGDREDGIGVLMENLIPVLKPDSVVAICTDKKQKIKTEKYRRLEKQLIGKRKFEIFALQDTTLESGAKI